MHSSAVTATDRIKVHETFNKASKRLAAGSATWSNGRTGRRSCSWNKALLRLSNSSALCHAHSFAASPNFKIRAQKTPVLRHSAGFLALGRDVSAGALVGAWASKKKRQAANS